MNLPYVPNNTIMIIVIVNININDDKDRDEYIILKDAILSKKPIDYVQYADFLNDNIKKMFKPYNYETVYIKQSNSDVKIPFKKIASYIYINYDTEDEQKAKEETELIEEASSINTQITEEQYRKLSTKNKKLFKIYENKDIEGYGSNTTEPISYIHIKYPSKEEENIIDISNKQIITSFELTLLKSYYDSFNLLKDTPTKTYLQNYLPHEMAIYSVTKSRKPNTFENLTKEPIPLEYTKQETEI